MSNPKRLRQRILILYTAFFVALAAGLLFGLLGSDFTKSFHDGRTLGERILQGQLSGQPLQAKILYDLPNVDPEMSLYIEGLNIPEEVRVSARINTIDLLVENSVDDRSQAAILFSSTGSVATGIYSFLLLACYVTIVILIFLIIRSLRRSLKSESVFEHKNIGRTRAIGLIIMAIALLSALLRHSIVRHAEAFLAGSAIRLDTSLQIDWRNMILGILILFIAEAFAIGYDMSQEQKLTI